MDFLNWQEIIKKVTGILGWVFLILSVGYFIVMFIDKGVPEYVDEKYLMIISLGIISIAFTLLRKK